MLRATLAAFALVTAPLAAQQPVVRDSVLRDTLTRDTTGRVLGADTLRVQRDSVVRPPANQALGVDAEVRAALFDLFEEEYLRAAGRLDYLRGSTAEIPAVPGGSALRGRHDLLFLLAESYYRLNMSEPFRGSVQAMTASGAPPRYLAVVQPQLLLDAYRIGEYERAIRLADTLALASAAPTTRALASFVAGLSAYQLRRYPEARAAFTAAQQGGPPYAVLARYMDALTALRADTAQIAPALQALESVAAEASGELADQIRLTASQLAYEAERYPEAAQLAGQIAPTSGLAAQAILTRAWALYKADQIEEAGQVFQEFGRRFPHLPEHEESLLLSAQALLQLGRTEEAAQLFRRVADSASAEVAALSRRGAMNELARRLVEARAAGLLFLSDPANGKTIALDNAAGAEWPVIAGAFGDTALPTPAVTSADIIALDHVMARLDSLAGRPGGDTAIAPTSALPRRVLFTQASATATRTDFHRRSQELHAADVAVALTRCRLDEALVSLAMRMTMLERLKTLLDEEGRSFEQTSATLTAAQDSLARLDATLDAAATRLRQIFAAQANVTRLLAAENATQIDSLRTTMAGSLGSTETAVLGFEAQTAQIYGQTAGLIESRLDDAIARHPVFALRDSIVTRGDSLRRLLASTQQLVAATQRAIDEELARLRAGEPEQIRALRSTLAAAEARQASVAAQLVTLVNAELEARSNELLADLRRDVEAAEFGSASAAFFQAIDAGRASTPARSGAGSSEAPPRLDANGTSTPPTPK